MTDKIDTAELERKEKLALDFLQRKEEARELRKQNIDKVIERMKESAAK